MAARRKRSQPKAARRERPPRARDLAKDRPAHRTAADKGQFQQALAAVARFLDASGRPTAIIGGVAVIAHGFARFTADIDACVVADPAEVGDLVQIARRFGLRPRIKDAQAFARANLVLLLEHAPTKTPVDLSLALQPFELEATEAAEVVVFAGVRIRVPSLTALLVYKMLAARPQDLNDVVALLGTRSRFERERVEALLAEFDALLDTNRLGEFRRLVSDAAHRSRT